MWAETFLLVFAAIFPVVNPPGAGLIFLGITQGASSEIRRWLARRVAVNAFVIMNLSLTVGALVLKLYGISIPVLRVAGGLIVAVAGWKLLNEQSSKTADETTSKERTTDFTTLAFYPLTMPLTTGPGTIAVMISLGLSRSAYSDGRILPFLAAILLATTVIALMIYICFAYSDRVPRLLGAVGTDILVRLTAFILFCLGVQIIWTGASELLGTVILQRGAMAMPLVVAA
jgi:multiple antibiotic resistance protein